MKVCVLGAGGHSAVVVATGQALGHEMVVFDDDPTRAGEDLLGAPLLGPISAFPGGAAVIGIGDNRTREHLSRDIKADWVSLIHPRADVHASVRVGPGTVVFSGVVVQPRSSLGAHTIVNTSSSVDHDCVVESFAHVGPGVHLCGGVSVGHRALLGVGSCAIPGVSIGADCQVGAGAVVVSDVPATVTAVGMPARWRED